MTSPIGDWFFYLEGMTAILWTRSATFWVMKGLILLMLCRAINNHAVVAMWFLAKLDGITHIFYTWTSLLFLLYFLIGFLRENCSRCSLWLFHPCFSLRQSQCKN